MSKATAIKSLASLNSLKKEKHKLKDFSIVEMHLNMKTSHTEKNAKIIQKFYTD